MMIDCACGCGKQREQYDRQGRARKFLSGHSSRVQSVRDKLSAIAKADGRQPPPNSITPEILARRIETFKSRNHTRSQETRDKIAGTLRGQPGRPHTVETRKKISRTRKERGLGPTEATIAAAHTDDVNAKRIATRRSRDGYRVNAILGTQALLRWHYPDWETDIEREECRNLKNPP